jgi:hypothetical protein
MEIIRKESDKFKDYGDLPVGTVFELDQNILMKTDVPEPEYYEEGSDFLAVFLSNGRSLPIGCRVQVKVLNAELTVEEL